MDRKNKSRTRRRREAARANSLKMFKVQVRKRLLCRSKKTELLPRALHEKEKRPKGGFTRLQFFLLDLVTSFAYYVIPGFLFPTISVISLVSYMWKDSITAHQIGSAIHGLGIGWFGLDWATIAGFLGSPLVVPAFAIFNTITGFFLMVYVLTPISYWTNPFNTKNFALIASAVYDSNGQCTILHGSLTIVQSH